MPTHNERTVPSPERDEEELEKLIQMETEGCKNACRMIWRISARRAREKAIGECLATLPGEAPDEGWGMTVEEISGARSRNYTVNDIRESMEKLKSKTN